jgi:adenylylsulfate kinase-like enzyme
VSPRERRERLRQSGVTIWLTGLPGVGKSAIAYAVERRLFDLGRVAMVVDPADGLGPADVAAASAPGYAAEIARRSADAGMITLFAYASPSRAEREAVFRVQRPESFLEIHVALAETPPPSTLSYEAPDRAPTVSLDAAGNPDPAADVIVRLLEERGFFDE